MVRRMIVVGLVLLAPATAGAEETQEAKWYERVKVSAFVDAYANVNPRNPKSAPFAQTNRLRAYDQHNGFGLHWVGADAIIEPEPVGATVSLRFGPSAAIYTGSPDNELGLTNVKQAFVSYKPGGAAGKLKLVAGKFDTIYGAEVAESQLNITYTRSALNFYAQPFFHTGLRADYQFSEKFEVRGMVVNGWNNAVDNNAGKTFGLQLNAHPVEQLLVAVGWLGGPEQADRYVESDVVYSRGVVNRRFRHLVDAVIDWTPNDRFRALFNFDYATDDVRDVGVTSPVRKVWWGTDLTLRAKLHELAFVGVRGSYLHDRDGFLVGTGRDTRIASGTLTLGYTPTPNFMLKLEPRVDRCNEDAFLVGHNDTSRWQSTVILGVVATTN